MPTGIIHAAVNAATADPKSRTISGTVVFYGVRASASTGPVQFEPGSITIPADLSRVKLCLDHDHRTAVGFAIEVNEHGDRLDMKFRVPETPAGDEALASAANGLRDGLSVGAFPDRGGASWKDGTLHVTKAALREVSLTALPAFDDARVSDVSATATKENPPMEPETPAAAEAPTVAAEAAPVEAAAQQQATVPVAAAPAFIQQPPILGNGGAKPLTVHAAAQMAVQMIQAGANPGAIMAALSDVVPADDEGKGFIGRETWLGELWKARRLGRPLIDSISRRPLGRTTKVKGWQWETRPKVSRYTGNKTEIPSNKVKTKAIESDVRRHAGGWDIDRIYVDLGDPDMVEALWQAAVEDYALKTEAEVAYDLSRAATSISSTIGSVPAALVEIGAAAAGIGANVSFMAFGSDAWVELTNLTKDEIPWWMGGGDTLTLSTTTGSINGLRFFVDPTLPAESILGGDTRAATYYEAAPPIRVNAVDLPKGGIDLGLFGYDGLLVNDPASLFLVGDRIDVRPEGDEG